MTIEDLKHIFKPQLDHNIPNLRLFFMLIDQGRKFVERHPASDLEGLLPMLDGFHYIGTDYSIPRFKK